LGVCIEIGGFLIYIFGFCNCNWGGGLTYKSLPKYAHGCLHGLILHSYVYPSA